jgi:formate dehydrogenase
MDHGWGSRLFDPQGGAEPEQRGVNRNLVVPADELDELSGTPNLTGGRVNIAPAALRHS